MPDDDWFWHTQLPCTIISLFEEGCIQRAASYFEGGTVYRVLSPHIGGAADVGNCLRVIDKLCFQEKTIPCDEFLKVLQNNWEGYKTLRQLVLNKISYYGNDDDEADRYTVDVVDAFARLVLKYNTMICLFIMCRVLAPSADRLNGDTTVRHLLMVTERVTYWRPIWGQHPEANFRA